MALPRASARKRKATPVYALRVGEKRGPETRYVVGFSYPPKPLKLPIGSLVDWPAESPAPARPRLVRAGERPKGTFGVVVAPQAIALVGRGPCVYGWPHADFGLAAARETRTRIPGSTVVRVKDWRGSVM